MHFFYQFYFCFYVFLLLFLTFQIISLIEVAALNGSAAFTDLHCLVEDAAADLDHLQVLLLLVPRALDVGHPAPLVLLTGVYEVADRAVFIEHLQGAAAETELDLNSLDGINTRCSGVSRHEANTIIG